MLTPDADARFGLAQTSPAVRQLLANELMLALDKLIDASDPAIFHQLQGRARFIKELMNCIEGTDSGALRHPARHTTPAVAVR